MKSYTDIEQSKKLAEFLSHESADSHYVRQTHDFRGNTVDGKWSHPKYGNPNSRYANYIVQNFSSYETIPCWSLAALLDLLPSEFTTVGKYATTTYEIKIRKYKFANDVDIYQIAYGNYKFYEDGNSSWKDMINTGEKEELIDAAFEMVCWLKENNSYKE